MVGRGMDRDMMSGFLPWDNGEIDPDEQVIVVIARGISGAGRSRREIDHTAEIVMHDAPDPMSAFERTQADYNGTPLIGTPTVDMLDGDIFRLGE